MYIFPFTRIRYIKTITINTHIDCANNSKCTVGDILLATKQGAFESVFGTFYVSVSVLPSLLILLTEESCGLEIPVLLIIHSVSAI